MSPKSNSAIIKKKLSVALVKAKIVGFSMGFYIEEGINSKDSDFERFGG